MCIFKGIVVAKATLDVMTAVNPMTVERKSAHNAACVVRYAPELSGHHVCCLPCTSTMNVLIAAIHWVAWFSFIST